MRRMAPFALAFLLATPAQAQGPERSPLGPKVRQLAAEAKARGPEAALALAGRHRLRTRRDGAVEVLLEARGSRFSRRIDRRRLRALGAEVDGSSLSFLKVWIAIADLERLASHPDVGLVRAPRHAIPQAGLGPVVSEGVALIGAEDLYDAGITGAGVSVAVIDAGFRGLNFVRSSGELPAEITEVDYTGVGIDVLPRHGTGVSEVLVDVAPGIDLTVIRIDTDMDFQNAVNYVDANDIDIVNLSLGFLNASYYDDLGFITQWVNDSRDVHGVFWAISAGNFAEKHWRGPWLDSDTDDVLEWTVGSPGDERLTLTGGESQVCVFLTWNQWSGPITTNLDLYAYNNSGSPFKKLIVVS